MSATGERTKTPAPQKFVLSPTLLDEYLQCLRTMTTYKGKTIASTARHMGVPIKIDEASPGHMVAADGTEAALR